MSERSFGGSIPETYDRYLGPMLFRPFAVDLAGRVTGRRLLEIAAGTGIATAEVARVLPAGAELVATDLSQGMLDVAAGRVRSAAVEFRVADATELPFEDGSFDAVFCQFGVMFVPGGGYPEMRRVLADGGRLVFSVWEGLELNPMAAVVEEATGSRFFSQVPHGYHDQSVIRGALGDAGFDDVEIVTVTLPCEAASAEDAATGLCQGTPLRNEIVARDPDSLAAVTAAAAAALRGRFGDGAIRTEMTALLVTARVGSVSG